MRRVQLHIQDHSGGLDNPRLARAIGADIAMIVVHVDDEFAGVVFELLRDSKADALQRLACLRTDLVLLRAAQDNLHRFELPRGLRRLNKNIEEKGNVSRKREIYPQNR